MSLQTTMARAEARNAEEEWKWHKRDCPRCAAPPARRFMCAGGAALFRAHKTAQGALKREREADKGPAPGQGGLF